MTSFVTQMCQLTTKRRTTLIMAADVLCAYPDQKKLYKICIDASNHQLGACIMRDDHPVAYNSRKLNIAQCNYATIDNELLCVIVTLKEFWSMLRGAELHIYTDHMTIPNVGNSSEWQLCRISDVDEYGPTTHYIKGPHDIIADTSSRLSRKDVEILKCFLNLPCCPFNEEKEKRPKKRRKSFAVISSLASERNNHFCNSNAQYCYLNLPDDMVKDNPLD